MYGLRGKSQAVGAPGDMPELTRRKRSEDLELPNSSQGCCWGWGGSPQQWRCVRRKQMAFWWVYGGGKLLLQMVSCTHCSQICGLLNSQLPVSLGR